VAFAVTAFHLLPLLLDAPRVNRSRWEPAWKWDSFGAREVLEKLLSGDLLDAGRLPVLSLLALAGVVIAITRRRPAVAATALLTLALLYPAARERFDFLAENRQWGLQNLEAHRAEAAPSRPRWGASATPRPAAGPRRMVAGKARPRRRRLNAAFPPPFGGGNRADLGTEPQRVSAVVSCRRRWAA
jgi:hypothetical protein